MRAPFVFRILGLLRIGAESPESQAPDLPQRRYCITQFGRLVIARGVVRWVRDAFDLPDLTPRGNGSEYAVFLMISNDLGWFSPSTMHGEGAVAVDAEQLAGVRQGRVFQRKGLGGQSRLGEGVQGFAGADLHIDQEGAPAPPPAVVDLGLKVTILPSAGTWGRGPAWAMYIVSPRVSRPAGTMLSKARTSEISPSRLTRSTRLRWPSVTRNPPWKGSMADWTRWGPRCRSRAGSPRTTRRCWRRR